MFNKLQPLATVDGEHFGGNQWRNQQRIESTIALLDWRSRRGRRKKTSNLKKKKVVKVNYASPCRRTRPYKTPYEYDTVKHAKTVERMAMKKKKVMKKSSGEGKKEFRVGQGMRGKG